MFPSPVSVVTDLLANFLFEAYNTLSDYIRIKLTDRYEYLSWMTQPTDWGDNGYRFGL